MEKKKASVEEIMAWIQNKLEIHGQTLTVRNKTSFVRKYRIQKFSQPIMEILVTLMDSYQGKDEVATNGLYKIDLSKLSTEINVRGDTENNNYSEIILCNLPNKNAIEPIRSYTVQDGKETENDVSSNSEYTHTTIRLNDKIMAERIANAFHDAIELCGGKPELY